VCEISVGVAVVEETDLEDFEEMEEPVSASSRDLAMRDMRR